MRRALLLVLIAILSAGIALADDGPYKDFIKTYTRSYRRDSWRRPKDSLVYIVEVENLISNSMGGRQWDMLSVGEKRSQLFSLLGKKKLWLEYNMAIDLDTGEVFQTSDGNMDFINREKNKKVFFPAVISLWHRTVVKKMQCLIKYLQENKADHIFQVSGLLETDKKDLYWIIRGDDILAIVISSEGNTLAEYPADYFLNCVAEDQVFSLF
jgi:hypothetical protein